MPGGRRGRSRQQDPRRRAPPAPNRLRLRGFPRTWPIEPCRADGIYPDPIRKPGYPLDWKGLALRILLHSQHLRLLSGILVLLLRHGSSRARSTTIRPRRAVPKNPRVSLHRVPCYKVPYALTPLSLTLTKTAGVYTPSSQIGTLTLWAPRCVHSLLFNTRQSLATSRALCNPFLFNHL